MSATVSMNVSFGARRTSRKGRNYAFDDKARLICERFPPGPERRAWLRWLRMLHSGRVQSHTSLGRAGFGGVFVLDPARATGASYQLRLSAVIAVFVGLLTLTAGCAATPRASSDPTDPISLDFLSRGPVARTSVIDALGPPYATYEAGRVLTYRLSKKDMGYVPAPLTNRWEGADYDLVLVFDVDGQLQQHNLVVIRAPSHP